MAKEPSHIKKIFLGIGRLVRLSRGKTGGKLGKKKTLYITISSKWSFLCPDIQTYLNILRPLAYIAFD